MTSTRPRISRTRRTLIAAAAVAAGATITIALSGCTPSHDGHSAGASASAAADSTHDDADAMFVQMMIPHHRQAVEMSDMLLDKTGIDGRVTTLAREIKDAQGPEIATMTRWASSWGVSVNDSMSMDHGSMSGMMSADDMDQLRTAQGADASRLFLDQMIRHHTGAVAMAQDEIRDGRDASARRLAESIVATQQREIATMRQLLGQV